MQGISLPSRERIASQKAFCSTDFSTALLHLHNETNVTREEMLCINVTLKCIHITTVAMEKQ